MTAYYNEIDPFAAQWLRNLINAGHIAPGIVDERSIEDVYPSDLRGFTQCHFFAGIGVWSHALRSAGWGNNRPVWTGSCPCQPFSAAGQGAGFDDQRHLWPHFHHLIKECSPAIVLGEQVASKDADPWIDLVQADVEALGYSFGAVPFPSASVGAPHIRDRLYWVANSDNERRTGQHTLLRAEKTGRNQVALSQAPGCCAAHRMADAYGQQRQSGQFNVSHEHKAGRRYEGAAAPAGLRSAGGLADAAGGQHITGSARADQRAMAGSDGALQAAPRPTGPTNGHWADADWLFCRDGKWRPVEPGTFPLVNGAPSRVGRLRAYGNCINAKAGEIFIRSVMESIDAH
jgi:DNA (cytosine-5)-methyltransferase 1